MTVKRLLGLLIATGFVLLAHGQATWAGPDLPGTLPNFRITLDLQRPNAPPPDPSWQIPVRVTFSPAPNPTPGSGSFDVMTDQSGVILQYMDVITGVYDIDVKNLHTLSNKRLQKAIAGSQLNSFSMGTLLEGDAYADNVINVVDFSVLRTTYFLTRSDPGFDARADFDENGIVNIRDFSLWRSNFGRQGPIIISGSRQAPLDAAGRPTDGTVDVSIRPALQNVAPGQIFSVTVHLAAGSQTVDGTDVGLSFDPNVLQVVDAAGNPASGVVPLPGSGLSVLLNRVNNAAGTIEYSAFALSTSPSGSIDLFMVRLRAGLPAPGTRLHFEPITDVVSGTQSVLGSLSDGYVTVGSGLYTVFLPDLRR